MAYQIYCPSCGAANPPDAHFCANCRSAFVTATAWPPPQEPPPSPPPQKPPPYTPPPGSPAAKPKGLKIGPLEITRGFKMGRFEIIGIVVLVVVLMMGCLTMAHPSSNNPTPTPTVVPTVEASVAATPTVKATATPTVKATATPAKPTATPGTASDSDFSMTARSQGTYLESNQFEQPSAGDKYVQIYVEVTNKNQKDAMIGNQFQFTLFDNKNIGHQAATASFGAPNNLQSLNHANPGDKVAGVIIFEMPTGNIPSKIVFDEPGLFGGSLTVNF